MTDRVFMRTGELAAALGVSRSTVRRWCEQGLYHDRRPGGRSHRYILLMSIAAFIDARPALRRRLAPDVRRRFGCEVEDPP
jgi:excisionase family DNA binding protein